MTDLDGASAKPQLSRREREEIEKAKAKANYQKLHAAGKTEEARADLARLAIIRKQREEAAAKREAEKKAKEEAAKAKADAKKGTRWIIIKHTDLIFSVRFPPSIMMLFYQEAFFTRFYNMWAEKLIILINISEMLVNKIISTM